VNRPAFTPFGLFALIVLALICVGLQSSYGAALSLGRAEPDFLLVLLLCAAFLTDSLTGCVVGFCCGLLASAVSMGLTIGSFLITRVLVGFVAGGLRKRFVSAGIYAAIPAVLFGTILTGLLYGLFNPRIGLTRWTDITLWSALYNTALALPIAWILRRCGWGR
jgi:rod shape-determining protein MreD